MLGLTVRRMQDADQAATAALWHESWHDAHGRLHDEDFVATRTLDSFLSRLPVMQFDSYVADQAGMIAGFGTVAVDTIDHFYVGREYRGKGVASALLAVLEEELKARGTQQARLKCALSNMRAAAFYRRHDWTDRGPQLVDIVWPDGRPDRIETRIFTKRLGP